MVPSRRTVLGLLGGAIGGLAGCSALQQNDVDRNETQTPVPMSTPTDTPTPPEAADITVDETWAMFQSDAAHTSYASDLRGPGVAPAVNWRSESWGLVTSPIVSDGTIFFATGLRHRHVHALDAETGDEHWRTEVDGREENVLVVADGVVYAGMDRLSALDAETGEEIWNDSRDVREGITVAEGAVFAPSDAVEKLRAFHATTGAELWEYQLPGHLSATAVPAVHDGQVYLCSHEDVCVVDARTGKQVWQRAVSDRISSAATVTDDLVYVPDQSHLYALDTTSGDEAWRYEGRFRSASPALADETLYIGGWFSDGGDRVPRLLALDAATGEERWHLEREGFSPGSPVVADGVVYVASDDNQLYALDAATGDVHWTLQFEYHLGTPALLDDALVVSVGGRLYSIGRRPNPDARPWAGVVEAADDPDPDRGDSSPPEYTEHDFYFGTNGYDVTSSSSVRTTSGQDAPFSFTIDVTGDTIDSDEQVTIDLAVTNESDEELTIESGAPAPFGVVTLQGTDGTDGRLTAWTDAYEESHHVHTVPHRGVTLVNSIGLARPIAPGETVRETYTLSTETHGIQPGSYVYSDGFRIYSGDPPSNDGDEWTPEVTVNIDLAQPAPDDGDVVYNVAVSDGTEVPSAFIGALSVDVLEPVTDTHPGLIEITLENVTGELGTVTSPGRWPFGSHVGLDTDGSRIELIPEESYAPGYVTDAGADGSWIASFRPYTTRMRRMGRRRFEADARITKRYLVLGDPDADDPLTPGRYTFQKGYADDDVEFPWGFQLSIRDSDA